MGRITRREKERRGGSYHYFRIHMATTVRFTQVAGKLPLIDVVVPRLGCVVDGILRGDQRDGQFHDVDPDGTPVPHQPHSSCLSSTLSHVVDASEH